jgi:hypothetical protein
MGVVFEADDLKLDRHLALLKRLANDPNDPQVLERFRPEARAASALNANICSTTLTRSMGECSSRWNY